MRIAECILLPPTPIQQGVGTNGPGLGRWVLQRLKTIWF